MWASYGGSFGTYQNKILVFVFTSKRKSLALFPKQKNIFGFPKQNKIFDLFLQVEILVEILVTNNCDIRDRNGV